MSDILPVFEELLTEADAGRPAALCVVVRTRGSTPQSPGAAMLLKGDHSTVGTLGGGCVEEEVKRKAFQTLTTNASALFDFVLDHNYGWDDGLICGGKMDVAVVPVTGDTNVSSIEYAVRQARSRQQADVCLPVQHQGKTLEYRLHLEVPPTLLIAGAGHVGQAVARLMADLDFHVVVFDDRADYASPERFDSRAELIVDDIARALKAYTIDSSCYVVIVTRGHNHDHQALDAVIGSEAGYIGLIGSKRKARMILGDLKASGVPAELVDRVYTPIGLHIGAVTVSEIAVSIAAELVQTRRRSLPKLVEGPTESSDRSYQ